jgi:predicted kinase
LVDYKLFQELSELADYERIAIMAIGIPACGKSTFYQKLNDYFYNSNNGYIGYLSTDDFFEMLAEMTDSTYNDVFAIKGIYALAEKRLYKNLAKSVRAGEHMFWDQTNLTKKSRAQKLSKLPEDYLKVAIDFPIPVDITQRLASRPGKSIPMSIIHNMMQSHQEPDADEGFDIIRKVII